MLKHPGLNLLSADSHQKAIHDSKYYWLGGGCVAAFETWKSRDQESSPGRGKFLAEPWDLDRLSVSKIR